MPHTFQSLSAEEQWFWQECLTVFERVQAKQPEKGVLSLLQRARRQHKQTPSLSYKQALKQQLDGARTRTESRLQVLGHCSLLPPVSSFSTDSTE